MAEAGTARRGALRARRPRRLERAILTPEGVALQVHLASRGDRAIAFLIDVTFIVLALLGLVIFLLLTTEIADLGPILLSLVLVALFVLRNFYFTYFEIRRAGQTPGKRIVAIKVIDRRGGPLGADAVIARNLTREIEIFLPLSFLAGGGGLLDNDIARLAGLVWVGIFALMPLFNRDNLRVGDMVGGTWVVVAPKATLLRDLADPAKEQFVGGRAIPPREPRHRFTDAELDVYGIYELQTLEDVLRREDGPETGRLIGEVSERIIAKIGREPAGPGFAARAFLEDYYAALRRRLETRMLFGERRERKRDRTQQS